LIDSYHLIDFTEYFVLRGNAYVKVDNGANINENDSHCKPYHIR